jgi:hypothetical protein
MLGSSMKFIDFGKDLILSVLSTSVSSSLSFELVFSSFISMFSCSEFTSISVFSSILKFSVSSGFSSLIFNSILSQIDGILSL